MCLPSAVFQQPDRAASLEVTVVMDHLSEKNGPSPMRPSLGVYALGLILILAAFVWWVYLPQYDEIGHLKEEVSRRRKDVKRHEEKLIHLDELKKENAALQRRLADLKEQLPQQPEIEGLLKQVDELGRSTGLNVSLLKPADKKENASGLYVEIPVSIDVVGGYQSLRLFFDKVARLPRIINVSHIRIGNPRIEQNKTSIQTSFLATVFAAYEGKQAPEKRRSP